MTKPTETMLDDLEHAINNIESILGDLRYKLEENPPKANSKELLYKFGLFSKEMGLNMKHISYIAFEQELIDFLEEYDEI